MIEKKPHKELDIKKNDKLAKDLKSFLREYAPQVKGFMVDNLFTGEIECYERRDKGPEGYDVIKRKFKDFEELKKYYESKSKKSVKVISKPIRGDSKGSSKKSKAKVAKSKSKKRNK